MELIIMMTRSGGLKEMSNRTRNGPSPLNSCNLNYFPITSYINTIHATHPTNKLNHKTN